MAVHDRLALAGKTSTAHRVIGWTTAIYDCAIKKGLTENLYNPISRGIGNSLVKHKTKHYPRIKITKLPKLLADIDSSQCEPITKYGFYVMCYIFVRTKELRGMRWAELDFENHLWHIPADRMKNGLAHIVPLAPQVLRILKDIQAMKSHDDFVFCSNRRSEPTTSTHKNDE